MEKKLEDKEIAHQNQLKESNKQSEDAVNELKALFGAEKLRLEEKLKDEKTKNAKKVSEMIEEYENKLKDQETELKEELENLQYDYKDLEDEHETYMTKVDHDFEMYDQKIKTSEAALKDSKDQIAVLTEKNNT